MPSRVPSRIRETVRTAFSQTGEPWFPGIAERVTAITWRRLAFRGFTAANYGTHRWLENDPTAARSELASLDLGGSRECRIEALPATSRARYERYGLVFSGTSAIESHVASIRPALSFIALVPSLYANVATYLRTMHVLQAPSAEFDVSHSDPHVPFSVFVSIPLSGPKAKIRLAESIIHECMHLQLTLIDAVSPLVACREASAFSPWREGVRPLNGVLHGLYVFTVIAAYFRTVELDPSLTPAERTFVARRRGEIAQEVAQVTHIATAEGLTDDGRILVSCVLRCVDA